MPDGTNPGGDRKGRRRRRENKTKDRTSERAGKQAAKTEFGHELRDERRLRDAPENPGGEKWRRGIEAGRIGRGGRREAEGGGGSDRAAELRGGESREMLGGGWEGSAAFTRRGAEERREGKGENICLPLLSSNHLHAPSEDVYE